MRIVHTAIAVVIVGTLPCAVSAGQGFKGKHGPGVRGVVTSVGQSPNSFSMRAGRKSDPNAQEVTIEFSASTQFMKLTDSGPSKASSSDLSVGSRVGVVYTSQGGKNVASRVVIIERTKKKG